MATDDMKRKKGLTPLQSIRARCMNCVGFEPGRVRECDSEDCPLHRLRMGRGSPAALKPIRATAYGAAARLASRGEALSGQGVPVVVITPRQTAANNLCRKSPRQRGFGYERQARIHQQPVGGEP